MVFHSPRHPQLKANHLTVPLLIRLMEYSREDAKSDMDLHQVAERLSNLRNRLATMDDYEYLVGHEERKKNRKNKVIHGAGEDDEDFPDTPTPSSDGSLNDSMWSSILNVMEDAGIGITDVLDILKIIYQFVTADNVKSKLKVGKKATILAVWLALKVALGPANVFLVNPVIRWFMKEIVALLVGYIYDRLVGTGEEIKGKGTPSDVDIEKTVKQVKKKTHQHIKEKAKPLGGDWAFCPL